MNVPAEMQADISINSQPKHADDRERAHMMSVWAAPQKALGEENKVKEGQS